MFGSSTNGEFGIDPSSQTKRLTLEEMDLVFGSSGVAAADQERMAQINAEIGLDRKIHGGVTPPADSVDEKTASTIEKTVS